MHCCSGLLPDRSQVTVVVDYVKVRHGAVALLFPGLILKLLQGDPLGVGVDTQHLGRLRGKRKKERKKERQTETQRSTLFIIK